ncbi:MAG: hypothetical protein MMC23_002990 [Stictis urceolatum]|nr:hypothetical protein [Stictis urceolata]
MLSETIGRLELASMRRIRHLDLPEWSLVGAGQGFVDLLPPSLETLVVRQCREGIAKHVSEILTYRHTMFPALRGVAVSQPLGSNPLNFNDLRKFAEEAQIEFNSERLMERLDD